MNRKVTREWLIERLEEDYTCKRAAKERKIARRHFLCVLHKGVTNSFFFTKQKSKFKKQPVTEITIQYANVSDDDKKNSSDFLGHELR